MSRRLCWIGLSILGVLMFFGAQGTGWATCGVCQVCQIDTNVTLSRDFCRLASNEDGSMCCTEQSFGVQTYCTESGTLCYGVIVGGGGGGGTGGGAGGGCRYQNGWCPAECWSCSGGTT